MHSKSSFLIWSKIIEYESHSNQIIERIKEQYFGKNARLPYSERNSKKLKKIV